MPSSFGRRGACQARVTRVSDLRNYHRAIADQKAANVQAKLRISPIDLTPKSTGAPLFDGTHRSQTFGTHSAQPVSLPEVFFSGQRDDVYDYSDPAGTYTLRRAIG